jgi:hypothetical protein
MQLAKSRLFSNVMTERSHRGENQRIYITENQFIDHIELKLNYQKLQKYFHLESNKIQGNPRKSSMVMDLYRVLFPEDSFAIFDNNSFLAQLTANYIANKIDRISETYDGFESGYNFGLEMVGDENTAFLTSILSEQSHVGYKLLRAVNFLHKLKNNDKSDLFERADYSNANVQPVYEVTIDRLYEWMGSPLSEDVPTTLPPSFFDVDFVLSNGSEDEPSSIDNLSSGEMHFVHTIQSVIYHINNLQSVHASRQPRIKYRFVNIVLDEIELYFHPDLQRKLVYELRTALMRINRSQLTNIDGINIMLLTHSPFILSDIPAQNVLLLELDEHTRKSLPKKISYQTFAGNVNEILSDSFFLGNSLIGKFAEEKLASLVDKKGQETAYGPLVSIIGDTFLKSHIEEYLNG